MSTSVLPTLTVVTSMQCVVMPWLRSYAHAKLVIQGMEGRALVKAVFLLSVNAINILCKQIIPTGVERASITKCAKTYNNSL